jgi:REase_DpnII-MboI
MKEAYDLRELTGKLTRAFPQIEALYLFGSRRYRTGSPRSDVDILVEFANASHIRPQELRAFSAEYCRALDLFVAEGGKAVSCANESHVRAASFGELVTRLEAVCFWNRSKGILPADVDWNFEVPVGIDFKQTAMLTVEPIAGGWLPSFRAHAKALEDAGIPVRPYLGSSVVEIADFLVGVLRKAVETSNNLNDRQAAWRIVFKTEYDFQNLFFAAVKPWLPGLGREEITVWYDGQEKRADFNLLGSQIVVEMKHIRDAGTKAAVGKTLAGLASFYEKHPNVRLLLFAILVDKDVELDAAKWESDFTFTERTPQVWTRIFRTP